MKSLKIMLSVVFACLTALSAKATEAEYDLRFVQVESEQTGIVFIDIEMRATASDKEFYLAEQNFRFSFNEDAVFPYQSEQTNITIEQELTVSGQVAQSFYAPHHLNGSAGNVISYNVELLSGEGVHMTSDEWTKIGRIAFQLKNPNAQLNLTWLTTENFPPTYIVEKRDDNFVRVEEGNFEDFSMAVSIEDPLAVSNALQIFPNPATTSNTVHLTLNSQDMLGAGHIVVADALGRTVSKQMVSVEKGVQTYNIDVQSLSAGTYHVNVQTATWQSISKPLVVIEK